MTEDMIERIEKIKQNYTIHDALLICNGSLSIIRSLDMMQLLFRGSLSVIRSLDMMQLLFRSSYGIISHILVVCVLAVFGKGYRQYCI